MTDRTKRGQALHDRKLIEWALRLRAQGNRVLADLPGHERPPRLGGQLPDLVAKRAGRIKLIGEVETLATLEKDRNQQDALRRAAERYAAKFQVKVAKEKRS